MKTKIIILILTVFISNRYSYSQLSVSTDGSSPDSSAMLDIKSTTRGFLLPRMTDAELQTIPNPAEGLMVYCIDCGPNGLGALSIFMAGYWFTLSINNCTSIPSLPAEGIHENSETQIIWNWDVVAGASGYKWNMVNFYATAEDMDTSTSKTETGLAGDSPYTRYVWAYNTCGHSVSTTLTSATTPPNWVCGDSLTKNHIGGPVAPVTKTVTYGTVGNIPGEPTKCWITQNLGSDHQATAKDDATEPSAGWYWQFNRMQGYKHDGSTLTPAWTITSITEYIDWIAANDPCTLLLGLDWHVPTQAEWTNVDAANGWSSLDDVWNSALKLHAAGNLSSGSGALQNRGVLGNYWSNTQGTTTQGMFLQFLGTSFCNMNAGNKAIGMSVRCINEMTN